ncbi:alpha/beta hydrolase [Sediminibacterium sp. KACHI17]|uniref:Alpha/beta hydrolase n=2 Tax=Sediminibacterium sp. KACHI17 TaxID=1751071 RepID=A0AAT9GGQ1_9BACT
MGTLLMPGASSKVPVVLIIAGSGPTDRNGNNPMMKNESLHMLAQGLAAKGIASVRFDKRGIAASASAGKKEADLRFDDYIQDAIAWIELLKKDSRFSKVIVAGHSEGSLIGMVAANGRADGFVSIAGAGKAADRILKDQLATQPAMVKDPSYRIIDSLVQGKTVTDVSPMLFSLFRPSVQPYMISWFQYDPIKEITKLNIPVLIVQGTHDLQITTADADALAVAKPNAKKVVIQKMNHVLKIVEGGQAENIASYSNPSLPVSEALVAEVVSFVLGI